MTDTFRRILLATRPSGRIDASTLRIDDSAVVPEPGEGQALVKVQYLSIDPTIRTWMDDAPGYLPPIGIGDVVRSGAIGEVVASRTDSLPVGSAVFGMLGWQEYALADGADGSMTVVPPGVDPAVVLGVLGVTGMTAYFGLKDIGRPLPGDTVVVSGSAGATGSVVRQLARIEGAGTVVGIAGSPDKCAWLVDELGFDHAINYRDEDVAARIRATCPRGIDVYFDNVGGGILDACLANLAMHARVVLCGAISQYNEDRPVGPRNYLQLIVKRSRMEGFLILDYLDRFPAAQLEMAGWVMEGRIRHREHVVEGLEHAGEALDLLFSGGNTGKVVVAV
ncbi:MAG TPA: NADP-dependent oxidoreductase [Acidimicrobiales bacterium]|nr:NADP-dependent oxidoreductase [Acidimicrobiales bacterium]